MSICLVRAAGHAGATSLPIADRSLTDWYRNDIIAFYIGKLSHFSRLGNDLGKVVLI